MHYFAFGQPGQVTRAEASEKAPEARNGRRHQTIGQQGLLQSQEVHRLDAWSAVLAKGYVQY